jgi:hypothetical protein
VENYNKRRTDNQIQSSRYCERNKDLKNGMAGTCRWNE